LTAAEPKVNLDLLAAIDTLDIKGNVLERADKGALGALDSHLTGLEGHRDWMPTWL